MSQGIPMSATPPASLYLLGEDVVHNLEQLLVLASRSAPNMHTPIAIADTWRAVQIGATAGAQMRDAMQAEIARLKALVAELQELQAALIDDPESRQRVSEDGTVVYCEARSQPAAASGFPTDL